MQTREHPPAGAAGAATAFQAPLRGPPVAATVALGAGWATLAAAAALAGWVTVPVLPGLGLSLGAALLAAAALLVGRLPAAARPRPVVLGCLLGGAGIALGSGFLAVGGGLASTEATALGAGMCVSSVLVAAPLLPSRWIARLGVAGLAALPGAELARFLVLGEPLPSLLALLLPAAAFALVMLAVIAAATGFAAERVAWEHRQDRIADDLRRVTRHVERDQLTNSFSRRHIIEMLGREMARTDRTGEYFCVCLLDLDHFKALNDNFGHLTGDRILASFARRVRGELRSMDSVNRSGVQSALGRVGGEEFLVLLPHTSLRGALRVAERIRRAVNVRPLDGQHAVTVSIGIAEYRGSETVGGLLGRADKALYGAKRGGRNRVHCASREGSSSQVIMPEIPRASSNGG